MNDPVQDSMPVIINKSVTSQVADYLKKNIESCVWKAGEKIPSESQMTKTLGVSRASLRAAIRELVGLGILESEQGKGTFVKTNDLSILHQQAAGITKEDCQDIYKVLEFRRILEAESCGIAAKRSTPELIERLELLLKEMKDAVGDQLRFVKADMDFHMELIIATHNPLIQKSLQEIFEQTEYNHTQINTLFGYDGIYYHEQLLKAIKKKDSKTCSKYMREHLQHAIDSLEDAGVN